ncbi:MAG: endonuclease/exonuclease/phosphatase family protein [Polyangiaceae bacterium]
MDAHGELKVISLNIWNKSGPWPRRREFIRRELDAWAPDLVGLQEVLRLEGRAGDVEGDQLAELNQRLGFHSAYAKATEFGGGLQFGNGLLSRFPIVEHTRIALPECDSGEQRSALYALVQHPEGPLPVFVTHLNWKLHHGAVRQRQISSLIDHVFRLAPLDERRLPPIVMGDFNAEPDSDEMRFMRGLTALDGRTVYFTDCWIFAGQDGGRHAHEGAPGYTFDSRNPYAALAHEPRRRIDYIYVRGPDRKFRGEPLETRVVCNASDPTDPELWPTDHFGVFCRLRMGAAES